MELINKYFPNLTAEQKQKFKELGNLYREWNEKINVISRKDIDNLYLHHILHSLSIAKYIEFTPESDILDLGTGGGLPGIPLAILFPKVNFYLIDGTKKKITVVNEIVESLKLSNVKARQIRAEELKQKFDFVITRAVAGFDKLMIWSKPLIHENHKNKYPNGIIALKGNSDQELKLIPKGEYAEVVQISTYFDDAYFTEKQIIYVQV